MRRHNIILLVVDSLRAQSLARLADDRPRTPFFDRLAGETTCFRRAYATECWTLPTHVSMFTGLLPSEHGAHFQTMAYERSAPTIAELLGAAGYATALVTRNFVFDGTIPGVTRGFQIRERPLAEPARPNLTGLFLALAKPRVRRYIRHTGFFHPRHGATREFVRTFARALLPADAQALAWVLDAAQAQRRAGRPYFICCNLYDVHAPYPPQRDSVLWPTTSFDALADNLALPFHLAALGQHAYLEDLRVSRRTSDALRRRYHRAIELMDDKLAAFFAAARASRVLDDTVVIVTSDHGEAFGEHGLYLHDASVYDTHLHVPLWVHHPELPPTQVEDVVSTRDLFGVMLAAAGERGRNETILEPSHRRMRPLAIAEHFHYPRLPTMAERYRQNLLAVITDEQKFVFCQQGPLRYERSRDRGEERPSPATIEQCMAQIRAAAGVDRTARDATAHIRSWHARLGAGVSPLTQAA